MILSMSSQAALFLFTALVGLGLGFMYDIFRIIRKTFPHPNLLTQLEDILYWLLITFVMFYFMINKNYGEIRLFSICGAFLGMLLYFATISKAVMLVSVTVIEWIKRALCLLFKIILTPFRLLWKLISIPLGFLINFVGKKLRKGLQNTLRYAKIKKNKLAKQFGIIINKV